MFDNSIWCVHICAPRCENCNELKCHSQTHQFLLNRSVDVSCQHQVKSIHLYTECFSFFIILTTVAVVILFGHINSAQAMLPFAPLCVCAFSLSLRFQAHTTNSFHIVNLFKGFFNMHSKINIRCIMQKWNLLFSSSASSSSSTLFSLIKIVGYSCCCCCFRWMVIDIFEHQKRGVD